MAAHGLVPERVAPHAGGDDRNRRLAAAEAGDARAGSQIGRRVLECVVHIVLGDFDREANAILGELFDGRLHGPAIVPASRPPAAKRRCGREDSNLQELAPNGT